MDFLGSYYLMLVVDLEDALVMMSIEQAVLLNDKNNIEHCYILGESNDLLDYLIPEKFYIHNNLSFYCCILNVVLLSVFDLWSIASVGL